MKEHLGVKGKTLVLVFKGVSLNEFVVEKNGWFMGMVQN